MKLIEKEENLGRKINRIFNDNAKGEQQKKVVPFDTYKCYLSLKNHFTKDSYDYHKYCGKSRATVQSFYKRKDRFWFEKFSRSKTDAEVVEFFVSNFISCTDPGRLWIGEMMKEGDVRYTEWKKRTQSLSYIFKEEIESVFTSKNFDEMFLIKSNQHPQILKEHLQSNISLETMLILDKIVGYKTNFDKKLDDPVWKSISMKISKYNPFLNIDVLNYRKILKKVIMEGQ